MWPEPGPAEAAQARGGPGRVHRVGDAINRVNLLDSIIGDRNSRFYWCPKQSVMTQLGHALNAELTHSSRQRDSSRPGSPDVRRGGP